MEKLLKSKWTRFIIALTVLCMWHLTQYCINLYKSHHNIVKFTDHIHSLLSPVHDFFMQHELLANAALILTSAHIDIILVSLGLWGVFGITWRPFIAMLIIFIFRQLSQLAVSLPIPEGMIWHYPGFPSLIVTYYTTYDFFFSGHMASATLAILEVHKRNFKTPYLLIVVIVFAFIEACIMLSLRFHYSSDMLAGFFAGIAAFFFAEKISPRIDTLFGMSGEYEVNK